MTLRCYIPPGRVRPVTTAIQTLIAAPRAEPGCIGCSLSTEMGVEVVVHYVEEWRIEDNLKHQLRSDRFCTLAELMEHGSGQPIVEFVLPGGKCGLDYAEEVRGSGQAS